MQRSHAIVKIQALSSQTDQQFLKKTGATRLKNHKTHGIPSHRSYLRLDSRLTIVTLHAKLVAITVYLAIFYAKILYFAREFIIRLEQSYLFKEKRKLFFFFSKPL